MYKFHEFLCLPRMSQECVNIDVNIDVNIYEADEMWGMCQSGFNHSL